MSVYQDFMLLLEPKTIQTSLTHPFLESLSLSLLQMDSSVLTYSYLKINQIIRLSLLFYANIFGFEKKIGKIQMPF